MSDAAPPLSHQSSTTSIHSQKALSRAHRLSELREDPSLAHSKVDKALLPARPVDPNEANELHNPRWAKDIGGSNTLARFRYVWREELAECLGTAFIILFGASVECQTALHYNKNHDRAYSFGDYNSCRFAWAAGVGE